MLPNGGNSRQSARSPSPADSDISDVIVFTGRLNRASKPLARSEGHLLAPQDPASGNTSSILRSAPLPDPKHASVTEGSIAPHRAQKHEQALAIECHELENGQHSKPQLSPSTIQTPVSHGEPMTKGSEAAVAVHRCDSTSPRHNPDYGPKYEMDDDAYHSLTPEYAANSPRYKPSSAQKYDTVDDENRPMTPKYVGTSPKYKPEYGLGYDPTHEPRYDLDNDRYPAPKYVPVTPEYPSTSSLIPATTQASTGSPDASDEQIENDDEIEAARQEEEKQLEQYEIAINNLAERERELQRASEACDRASHRFLKHGLDEDECDRNHAEWARLRENYEEEVMWPSCVLYEQISDGVKKSMFERMDLGDPDFVFPSMTTMLRGQLEQRLKESAARTMKVSATEPDTLEAATQPTSSVVESTIKCSLNPHGRDSGLGVPKTKTRAKDGKQHVLYVDVQPIRRTHPLSKGTAYRFEVKVDCGEWEDSLAGKVIVSRAIQKALGTTCIFDGNSTAWSLEPLGQKRALIIIPLAKHVRGTPLPPSHIVLRQTRCYGVAVPKHYLEYLSKSDAHGHFNHDGEEFPARRSGECSGCKAEVQQMINDVLDRERRVVVSKTVRRALCRAAVRSVAKTLLAEQNSV
ncbi:Protein argonaute [Elasticomyces elasticus]|nr:Protein argonaute [Elasticomyces elasticus]